MIEKEKVYYKPLFYIFLASNIAIFFILLFVTGGESASGLLYAEKDQMFMDFFNSLLQSKNPYESRVIYPPLSNCMYRLLLYLVPVPAIQRMITEENAVYYSNGVLKLQQYMIPFILYTIVTLIFMFFALIKFKGGDQKEKLLFCVLCFLSGSMLFAFERANSVLVAFIGILFFLSLRNSENKVLKELGIISLAIATGIKIYPIVFFVLLLRDKKYKELIRGLIYCAVLFIVPMFLFYGGFDGILKLIDNLSYFTETKGLSTGVQLNFAKMIILPFSLFNVSNDSLFAIGDSFRYVATFGCAFAAIFSNKNWKSLCACACLIYGFQGTVATYLLIFFMIPAAVLLDEEKEHKKINYLYVIMLVIIITAPAIINPVTGEWTRFVGTKVTSYLILVLSIMISCSGIKDMCQFIKEKLNIKAKITVFAFFVMLFVVAFGALFVTPGGIVKGDFQISAFIKLDFLIGSELIKMVLLVLVGMICFAGIIFLAWWLPKDDKYNGLRQFVKFGIVGVSNTAVSLAVYYMFYFISEDLYFVGNAVGFVVSVLNAYYWNSKFVFKEDKTEKKKRKTGAVLLKTYLCYGSTFLLSEVMIIIEVELLHISGVIAPVINLLVTIPLNYILNKFWAYGEKRSSSKALPVDSNNEEK
ncbi:MAG: GtrA family protein [Clostridia bacterium]|nr:GtrA family protein [Clostridia bacterium]